MKPTTDFATTQAATNSVSPALQLPAGGHIVKILKAEANEDTLILLFDIAENSEYDDYYMSQYNAKKKFNNDVKFKGTYRQFVKTKEGTTNPYFKGLITAIEDSNPGYKWNWDENTLKGKKLGMVFRDEAWSYNGYEGITAKPFYVCKASEAMAMPVPKAKPLATQTATAPVVTEMTEANDFELPF